jgi:hypothetical protein
VHPVESWKRLWAHPTSFEFTNSRGDVSHAGEGLSVDIVALVTSLNVYHCLSTRHCDSFQYFVIQNLTDIGHVIRNAFGCGVVPVASRYVGKS